MSHLDALPPWAAILVAVLVLLGALFTLIGSIGLLRLKNFYQRVHGPTLGSTLGTFFILLASITCFSVLHSPPNNTNTNNSAASQGRRAARTQWQTGTRARNSEPARGAQSRTAVPCARARPERAGGRGG